MTYPVWKAVHDILSSGTCLGALPLKGGWRDHFAYADCISSIAEIERASFVFGNELSEFTFGTWLINGSEELAKKMLSLYMHAIVGVWT